MEAERKLQENLSRFLDGQAGARKKKKRRRRGGDLSLNEYLTLWSKARTVSPETRHKDRRAIEIHIPESIRKKSLKSITTQELLLAFEAIPSNMTRRPPQKRGLVPILEAGDDTAPERGISAQRNTYRALSGLFNHAIKKGHLSKNPLSPIPRPKPRKRPRQAEMKSKIDAVRELIKRFESGAIDDPQAEARLRIALLGLRPSEALGLTWSHIDSESIYVKQQLKRYDSEEEETGFYLKPQTKTGVVREVPLDRKTFNALIRLEHLQREWKKSPRWKPVKRQGMDSLVFTEDTGKPITQAKDRDNWRALLESQSYPYFPPNELRHISATLLRDGGANPNLIANLLGHSVEEENRTYYHPQVEAQRAEIERLVEEISKDHRDDEDAISDRRIAEIKKDFTL